jgi:hypothetical protein
LYSITQRINLIQAFELIQDEILFASHEQSESESTSFASNIIRAAILQLLLFHKKMKIQVRM